MSLTALLPDTLEAPPVTGHEADPATPSTDPRSAVSVGVDADRRLRRTRLLVAGVATLAIGVSVVLVQSLALVGVTGDEIPHLLAARRVLDSATPGLAQIGQYWPPLFHVLELPFVWIAPLYRSGLAGALPAALMYVVGVVGAFELGHRLTGSRRTGMVAALVYGANPNLLYLGAIPMMETTITATVVWSAAAAAGYARQPSFGRLVTTGAWVLLATWAHYAAWLLPFHVAILLVAVAAQRQFGRDRREFTVLAFGVVAILGMGLWLLWGYYIQDDPLFFAHQGAANIERITGSVGSHPVEGSFLAGRPGDLTYVLRNLAAVGLDVLGPLALATVVIGAAVGLLRGKAAHPVALTLWGGVFLATTLTVFGGTIGSPTWAAWEGIDTATVARAGTENSRYLLYLLPAAAGFTACAVGRSDLRRRLAVAVVAASLVWFGQGDLPTMPTIEQFDEFAEHATVSDRLAELDGTLLTNSRDGGDRILWQSGIDLRSVVTEVNGERYEQTRATLAVDHVLIGPGSDLSSRLEPADLRAAGFETAWEYDLFTSGAFRWALWTRDDRGNR